MKEETHLADLSTLESGLKRLLDTSSLDDYVSLAIASSAKSAPHSALMHVRFKEDLGNSLALADFLCNQALNYALSRKRRLEVRKKMLEAQGADISSMGAILTAVRDVFIEFHKEHPSRASEVGEVLAYCIAVGQLGAAQVAAKMSLKTSANMPVHGLDGLHAKVENGCLYIYFLESKLSQSANKGVADYAESVAGFGSNVKQYLLEYTVARHLSNLDSLEGEEKELALQAFDVMGAPSAVARRERSIGVILYKEGLFGKLSPVEDGQPADFHEREFVDAYAKLLKRHQEAASRHLNKHSVDPKKCRVYFVAVPDVNELRELFYNRLGYKPKGVK